MPEISERIVAALPVPETGNKLHYFSGAKLQREVCPTGFCIRVTSGGSRSFCLFYRHKGKAHLDTIGRHNNGFSVVDGIRAAQERLDAIRAGAEAKPARTIKKEQKAKPADLTVTGVLDLWLKRHVEGKLRSETMIKNAIGKLVKPAIGSLAINELRRSDVVKMLDSIADEQGEVQSDRVLSYLRTALNFHELRDDTFKSPIVRGMARTKPSEHVRDRILTDDEVRSLWLKADVDVFGLMLRFVLLTACRRSEASNMTVGEVHGDDWIIPASRYKTKLEHVIPLSEPAQEILNALPENGQYIFTIGGGKPISGFSQLKRKADVQTGVTNWCLHDLRRTARSLMSRAKVPIDHAERCLGHAIPGIRSVYDKHEYLEEKRDAFEALASMVGDIVEAKGPQ